MTTGFVFAERYLWHETGSWTEASPWIEPSTPPESPEPKRRIRNLLEVSNVAERLTSLAPRCATRFELERFHTPSYIERISSMSQARGGNAGGLTPFGRGSYEIARLAAGGVITAVDSVLKGIVDNAYALVRPPGHHASPDRGDGFCLFNNIAVAVNHARAVHGLHRIAVLDWDVHHGNGTEAGFYEDPEVLTLSIHQDRWYPVDTGAVEDNGRGAGVGSNLNIPLPPGCGWGAYEYAFEKVVEPALLRFRPQLILIACGLDANSYDPFGRMLLDSAAFREMTRRTKEIAAEVCSGRLIAAHEGGYSAEVVPFCALAVIEELAGLTPQVVDPFLAENRAAAGHTLLAHQAQAVELAQRRIELIRRCEGADGR